ncbi:unnamed protein product [Wickerhamomyces anomalus]
MTCKEKSPTEGWTIRKSRSHNREYFFKEATKESVWDPPAVDQDVQLHGNLKTLQDPKEEAIEILQKHQQAIKNGEKTLGEIAQTESDCSSHKRGGDLGFFERGAMQPPFEKATFDLEIGQISDIVETDSGVHLIERTG